MTTTNTQTTKLDSKSRLRRAKPSRVHTETADLRLRQWGHAQSTSPSP